jgi:hypothetical protein
MVGFDLERRIEREIVARLRKTGAHSQRFNLCSSTFPSLSLDPNMSRSEHSCYRSTLLSDPPCCQPQQLDNIRHQTHPEKISYPSGLQRPNRVHFLSERPRFEMRRLRVVASRVVAAVIGIRPTVGIRAAPSLNGRWHPVQDPCQHPQ